MFNNKEKPADDNSINESPELDNADKKSTGRNPMLSWVLLAVLAFAIYYFALR